MDLGLSGKSVLVCGGATGIGRSCVDGFVREGARVAVLDWNRESLDELAKEYVEQGTEVLTLQGDVSDSADVKAAHAAVIDAYGSIDVGFNNAGIISPSRRIEDTTEEDFDRVVAVNLKGIFLCMREQVRHMHPRGAGVIVNTASAVGLIGSPGSTPYVATKHGVVGMTRTAGIELAGSGVRVNAVAPGAVDTPLGNSVRAQTEDPFPDALAKQDFPFGRRGRMNEIADAVLWLASERSTFATGSALVVDGGLSAA